MYKVKGFDIILGQRWVRDINRTYRTDHGINKIWMNQCHISWYDGEKGPRIHSLRGLQPDSNPADDTTNRAAQAMGIKMIGNKHLCRMDRRVLARAFMI